MKDTIFELYAYSRGRWSLVERYDSARRDGAMLEAKQQLNAMPVQAVRIIRETFDPDAGLFRQRTVFRDSKGPMPPMPPDGTSKTRSGLSAVVSPGLPPKSSKSPRSSKSPKSSKSSKSGPISYGPGGYVVAHGAYGERTQSDIAAYSHAAYEDRQSAKRGRKGRDIFTQKIRFRRPQQRGEALKGLSMLLLVALISGVIALFAAEFDLAAVAKYINPAWVEIGAAIAFTLSTGLAIYLLLQLPADPEETSPAPLIVPEGARLVTAEHAAQVRRILAMPRLAMPAWPDLVIEETVEPLFRRGPSEAPPTKPGQSIAGLQAPAVPLPPPELITPAPPASPPVLDPPAASTIEIQSPAPVVEPGTPIAPMLPTIKDIGERVMEFINDALANPIVQAYQLHGGFSGDDRFACHLFVLGAALAGLGGSNSVRPEILTEVLRPALARLGSDKERTRNFVTRQSEYLRERRHRGMIERGMAAYLRLGHARSSAGFALADALRSWRDAPENDADSVVVGIAVIDFRLLGDASETGAEMIAELRQVREAILNGALRRFRGHQIKLPSEQVKAVFPRPNDALALGIELQREINSYNMVTNATPLGARIGLAAGEPGGDPVEYFGPAARLAEKLCATAQIGEILIADQNFVLARDSGYVLNGRKSLSIPGFSDAQSIAHLVWSDPARAV